MITGGAAAYQRLLQRLRSTLSFGKWYEKDFEFTGRKVKQGPDFSIVVGQPDYAVKIPRVDMRGESREDGPVSTGEGPAQIYRRRWMLDGTNVEAGFVLRGQLSPAGAQRSYDE